MEDEEMYPTYPTWNRYIKMWKTIIFPVIKRNVNIYSWSQPTSDESYEILTEDIIDDAKLSEIIGQVEDALTYEGYIWSDTGIINCNITIEGKDRYSPEIGIAIYTIEDDDDQILDGRDDMRWTLYKSEPCDDFGFNLNYSNWLKEQGAVDNYDNIRKAPDDIKKSYCNWVRSTDYIRLVIDIMYVE